MVEGGRDLWTSCSSNFPQLKQGHLELAAQDSVQMAFEYLQRDSLKPSGQPLEVPSHPDTWYHSREHVSVYLPALEILYYGV